MMVYLGSPKENNELILGPRPPPSFLGVPGRNESREERVGNREFP
jgi:hypothetical protein